MGQQINWKLFEEKYWKPQDDVQHQLLLSNWRVKMQKFKDAEESRPTLIFDVLVADNVVFDVPKEFSTTSSKLCKMLQPIVNSANAMGVNRIKVMLMRSKDKKYVVVDLGLVDEVSSALVGR